MLSEKSQARLDQAQREIENLKMKRKDVETSITSTIQTLRHALDYIREQDSRNEKMGLGSNNDTPQGADVSEDPDHQFVQGFSS
jgi:predicted transcriptional regulator